jgi:uncharacterized membrane protein YbhN (UPF0104 family)
VLLGSLAVVTGVAVVLATHRQQAHALWNSLTAVSPAAIAVVLLLVLCQLGFQALRLWTILPRGLAVPLGRTAHAFVVGEWLNIFTPARGGDALKVVLLSRAAATTGSPPSLPQATGALLADKIVDAGSLGLLVAAAGLVPVVRVGVPARLPDPRALLVVAAIVTLLVLAIRRYSPRWLERLAGLRRELGRGLAALRNPFKLVAGVSLRLGAWLAELAALRLLCTALAFAPSPGRLVLALVALNLGISVPLGVANMGVYEAVLSLGLTQSGIPLATAAAIATLHHALQLLGTNVGAASLSLWAARSCRAPATRMG